MLVGVAQFALKALIVRFLADNPQVTVRQQVTNQNIDLIASGVDMSIRGHTDSLPDSTLIQRLLAVVEWTLFASPDYPSDGIVKPADLTSHQTLCLGWQAPGDHWVLAHKSGARERVRIVPYTLRGAGDAYQRWLDCRCRRLPSGASRLEGLYSRRIRRFQ